MTVSPTQVGRYAVARELGSGGMGDVYLAYSPAGSPVTVKVIRTDKLDPVARARFEKEALPDRYGPWQTVYERFCHWESDGTWARLLEHVQVRDDAVGRAGGDRLG
jgi:serine/threonine protein kinase